MYVTQWFNPGDRPKHIGVYQRLYPIYRTDVFELSYWDGKQWYADKYPDAKWISCYQHLKWRGIAK